MLKSNRFTFTLSLTAVIITCILMFLGNYIQVTNVASTCPGWPFCHSGISASNSAIDASNFNAAGAFFSPMTHRYVAALLGIMAIFLLGAGLVNRQQNKVFYSLSIFLIVLIGIQMLLGQREVFTHFSALFVVMHMLLGLITLSVVWGMAMSSSKCQHLSAISADTKMKPWLIVGIIILCIQWLLGGWANTHFTSFICPGFPGCFIDKAMSWNFTEAFNLTMPVGKMSISALATIQMSHRLWGIFTFIYFSWFSIMLMVKTQSPSAKKIGMVMLPMMVLLGFIGILSAQWLNPTIVAMTHNTLAIVLWLMMMTLGFGMFAKKA